MSILKFNRLLPRSVASLALAGLAGLFAAPAHAQQEEKILNIYNWAEYLPDGLLEAFTKETGIKVRYDTYDSNEVLHSKLTAGKTGYDIVVPSSNWAAIQIQAGMFKKLDRAALTNWNNLDTSMLAQLGKVDAGNQYLVNWAWGFITIGINQEKVKAALGTMPMPDDAWSLLFDPKYADKLKSCGISVLDSATEVFPAALAYLGKNPYSADASDYKAAAKVMAGIRKDIKMFNSSGYITDMANGGLCMALGYSGDFNISATRAKEAKASYTIVPLIPKNGGLLFMDSMAITSDAKHPKNALVFINYMLRAESAASITKKMTYATMNAPSVKLLPKEIASNPSIFLSDDNKKKLIPSAPLSNDTRRVMTRLFTSFKSGV